MTADMHGTRKPKRKGQTIMGMAASQARFLGLTARKSNVEYEGQQVNQQRTTLSNQSANYYNQLLGMAVPVPPSSADYTKTVYTFEDGSLNNSISTMIAQTDGTYLISYTSSWTDDFAAVSAGQSIVTKETVTADKKNEKTYTYSNVIVKDSGKKDDDGNTIYNFTDADGNVIVGGVTLKNGTYSDASSTYSLSGTTLTQKTTVNYNVGAKALRPLGSDIPRNEDGEYTGIDEYLKTLSKDQLDNLEKEEREYLKILNQQYGDATWEVRYVQNTTTGTWSPYFNKKNVLDSAIYSDTGSSQSNIPAYTIGSAQKTEEVKGVTARMEQDSTGRIINVTLNPGLEDEVTYAVTTNTVTDQAAYDDAMNQYEYDKYEYDQSIQEINAKIEIIQSEDKNLELRLKQLDTEQDAIQTEMDAVQKVIEKNTESTFKTFG